jgi:hypothetical protein
MDDGRWTMVPVILRLRFLQPKDLIAVTEEILRPHFIRPQDDKKGKPRLQDDKTAEITRPPDRPIVDPGQAQDDGSVALLDRRWPFAFVKNPVNPAKSCKSCLFLFDSRRL